MIPIKHDMSATLDGYTNLVITFAPIPLGVTFHKKQFVVNELLCYLQNKLSEVPFSVLVKITSDYYILEVIKTAKCMCFRLVKVPGHRLRSCVSPIKAIDDVRDMIELLLSAELSDTAPFLAHDTSQVHPLSGESQELSSIFHNIHSIQSNIEVLTGGQNRSF